MGIWIGISMGNERVKLSHACHAFAEALPKHAAFCCCVSARFAMPHTFADITAVCEQ